MGQIAQKEIKNSAMKQRSDKILVLYLLIVVASGLFIYTIINIIITPRDLPSHNATIYDHAYRGSIISADGYTLSNSEKTYQASIRGSSIDPDKRDLFVTLFSIYSRIPKEEVVSKLKDESGKFKQGYILLTKDIHTTTAMQLKSLAHKLRRKGVFRWVKNSNGIDVLYGLDIIENEESRKFPLEDVLTPIIGYAKQELDEEKHFRPVAKKGLEKHYDPYIAPKKNGYFRGKRDVSSTIIHDKNSIKVERIDGMDLHLNIPLELQRRVELMLDTMKSHLKAEEIMAGVMESETGALLTLASSERFNPTHIRREDVGALNPKFSEYPYEAGSVMKPLSLSIALENGVVTPDTVIDTENGQMMVGKYKITDDHKHRSLSAANIIIESSNIGISKIAWKLTGKQFRDGMVKFGVTVPSGIDLSRDLPGSLKTPYLLNHKLHLGNTAYGYGMHITFAQLMKAYAAFNNGGRIMTPRIVNYLDDTKGKQYTLSPTYPDTVAISPKVAEQMHQILIKTVTDGTGKRTYYPGLEIGGKTGTAHIAGNGGYTKTYHSSFYGFANDKEGHKYTIGVLVVKPTTEEKKYFASKSAVPTFRNIVEIMVNLGYLTPDPEETQQVTHNLHLYQVEAEDDETIADNAVEEKTERSIKETPEPSAVTTLPVVKPQPVKRSIVAPARKPKPKREALPAPKPLPPIQNSPVDLSGDLF